MTKLECFLKKISNCHINEQALKPTSQFPAEAVAPEEAFEPLPLAQDLLFAHVLLQNGCVLVPSKCLGRT